MNIMWLITVGGGALLLGIVFAYALMRKRPLTRREQDAQDSKTRELYKNGD